MGYLKSCKCQCKTCTEKVLIGTPYRNEYVHRSTGWWHTKCLEENQGRKKIDWDATFKNTEDFVNTLQDKEDLIQYVCRQYGIERDILEYPFGRKLTEIYKGSYTCGDEVTPRDVINILSENMNDLNRMNKKGLYGINRLNWDLTVAFNNFWNKYKSTKGIQCTFEIKENPEYKIQYRRKPLAQNSDDVLGDLDEEFY